MRHNMPDTYAMYMPGMYLMYLAYVLHMPGTCLAYAYNNMSIQVRDLDGHDKPIKVERGICLAHFTVSYVMYMPCIYMAYIQMPGICQTYDWHLIDIYFSYILFTWNLQPCHMPCICHAYCMHIDGIYSCASYNARHMPDI